jgi:hypothetical protein
MRRKKKARAGKHPAEIRRNHMTKTKSFSMNSTLKMGGTICALALGLSSILRPVQAADDPDPGALQQWRVLMKQNKPPEQGCFHASYPNDFWEKVDCAIANPRIHPVHAKSTDDEEDVVGNGYDWVAYLPSGLISQAIGYLSASGVTSVQSIGVAAFDYQGILGPNDYSVQLNTNKLMYTSACAGGQSGCTVWQQFVYATNYPSPGAAGLFMQYWLLGWGSSNCPGGGWHRAWVAPGKPASPDCYMNSAVTPVPNIPITYLDGLPVGDMALGAQAFTGYNDYVFLDYGTEQWTASGADSVLYISQVWNKLEFNVLGDAGGSEAKFNSGSTINLLLDLWPPITPTCLKGGAPTGETNNLNLSTGTCTPSVDGWAYIKFSESN